MLSRRSLLAAAMLPLVAACSTAPRRVEAYHDIPAPEPTAWTALEVEGLEGLIAAAWSAHPDIEAALASAQVARAAAAQARATRQPLVQADFKNARTRQADSWGSSLSAGLDVSWELDTSGALAGQLKAAELRARSEAVLVRAARASLACEVAAATLAATVEVHRRNWANRYQRLVSKRREVVELKLGAGLVSRQDVLAARADEASALRQARRVEGELAESLARLRSLVGAGATRCDDVIERLAAHGLPRFRMADAALAGETFLQRPDLEAADLECQAVSAELAVAERAKLPKVNLGAALGVAAASLSGLSGAGALALSLTQAVQWKVLDGGRWQADVEYAQANERLASARYRQKAWAAMQETAIAMIRYRLAVDEVDAAKDGRARLEESRGLTEAAREGGLVDALMTLDAERGVLEHEALMLESAQLLAASMGRVLTAAAGPLPGLVVEFAAVG